MKLVCQVYRHLYESVECARAPQHRRVGQLGVSGCPRAAGSETIRPGAEAWRGRAKRGEDQFGADTERPRQLSGDIARKYQQGAQRVSPPRLDPDGAGRHHHPGPGRAAGIEFIASLINTTENLTAEGAEKLKAWGDDILDGPLSVRPNVPKRVLCVRYIITITFSAGLSYTFPKWHSRVLVASFPSQFSNLKN